MDRAAGRGAWLGARQLWRRRRLPPWQQDYFASTVIAAASRGNADALTFLEWESNFLVGRFTHAAQGFDEHDGAAYLIAISDAAMAHALQDLGADRRPDGGAQGWSNDDGWSQSQGDYAQLALATLAGIYRLTGSAEAKAAYEALVADGAPFVSAVDFAHDPTFAQLGDVSAQDTHVVEVQYLNDVWGGDSTQDRNLYVEDVHLNGVSTGDSAPLVKAGSVTFDVSYQDDAQHTVAPALVVSDQVFVG
jgi:hypothetical protein